MNSAEILNYHYYYYYFKEDEDGEEDGEDDVEDRKCKEVGKVTDIYLQQQAKLSRV